MHFLLVIVVCTAFVPDPWVGHRLDYSDAFAGTLLATLFAIFVGEALSRLTVHRLHRHPERRSSIVRWHYRLRTGHLGVVIACYIVSLFAFDWTGVVRRHWSLGDWILVDELLILLPFVAMLVAGWISYYRAERSIHYSAPVRPAEDGAAVEPEFWTRTGYVMFHVRHYLGLVLTPILVFTLIQESVRTIPWLGDQPWFQFAIMGSMALGVLITMPWFLMKLWGAKSLPAGPLRTRLEAAAQRLRFRYSDILLWNTRGNVANAMVTGLLPRPRYVLLSDSLIQHLKPEEVEAVFGHEVGHIKHRHMGLYLGFLLLSATVINGLVMTALRQFQDIADGPWVQRLLMADPVMSYLPVLMIMGGYVWLVFGFLSRRCERQADVYGCKTVSCTLPDCHGHYFESPEAAGRDLPLCATGIRVVVSASETVACPLPDCDGHYSESPEAARKDLALCATGVRTFISALEQVADLNGIRKDKPSWRHSSIARRVEFLRRLAERPELEPLFQRQLRRTKWALLACLGALCVVFWWQGMPVSF